MMDTDETLVTERIIGCAFTVANTLGIGFLGKVYANALAHEMRKRGLAVMQQRPIVVRYDNVVVGDYFADLIVDDRVIIELKIVRSLNEQHVVQCTNYLRATGLGLCLLINFGRPRIEVRRVAGNR
jgi:GxxExxY protein